MRIAVGGFMHETNTFVPTPTAWDDFVRAGPWPTVTEGTEILKVFRGINLAIAYFIEHAERAGHELVPLAWGAAQPAGRVTDDAFHRMSEKLVRGVQAEKPDAIFLELHGAMVTESHDDGERELLRRIRAIPAGASVPILASLDLHANVSREFVELADFVSSYRTYPHVDWGLSGARCAEWFDRAIAWGKPARAFRQSPFLIPVTAGCTYVEPGGGLYETLRAIETETGVHLSLNMGFPPADIPAVGPSITAYGADQATVDAAADRMLQAVLDAEPAFAAHQPLPVQEAVSEAMRIASTATRPVVLADTQDNPGAGAPSNTTGLIGELLRQRAERAVVGIMHDERAAALAHERGVGSTVDRLGGGLAGPGQEPLPGPWEVVALSDGRFRGTSPMLRAAETNMGKTAVLRQGGIEVLVATIRQQPIHREAFTHIGVDLASRAIVGVKSSAHFRSGYQEIAEKVIVCLAPGENPEDPARFNFTKIRPCVRLRPQG